MDNRQIAELISERIGPRPVPFEAVRTLALEIYHDLGGREDDENFADIFEILLSILPLTNLIDDTSIYLDKTWSSYKINASLNQVITTLDSKQDVLAAGQNIVITDNAIKAIGYLYNEAKKSFAEGPNGLNQANGLNSHAEGYKSIVSGVNSHAEGKETQAICDNGHAEGYNSIVSGANSHAEGKDTRAEGANSHAEGYNNVVTGANSHAEGKDTIAESSNSHVEGYKSIVSGANSHAEGKETQAIGDNSHAEGYNSVVSGESSHSEGSSNSVYGNMAHAEGHENVIGKADKNGELYGYKSHAEGQGNTVTGNCSHAEGINSTVSGNNAHTEGQANVVSGTNAHAEGKSNQATGLHAHTEGQETQATGANSHTEGLQTVASGPKTHAEGWRTVAQNDCEHASGMFNKSNNKDANAQTIFSIGIGTSDTDRKNAIEVLRDGRVFIKGIGGYDGTNPFDCNFGGIVCLTLGDSMETTQAEKIITVLQDILTNKKHYILTIYDTVQDKFFGDCEVVQSGTNSVNIISNYLSTTLSGYTIYYSFKTDTKAYTRNKYSVSIATKGSVDTLQKTIEALEARIAALEGQGGAQAMI